MSTNLKSIFVHEAARSQKLVDNGASTSNMLEYLKHIPHVKASIANEARSPEQANGAQIEAPSVRVG